MKKSTFLIVLGTFLFLTLSCSKNDDGPLGLGGGCGYVWSVRIADEVLALTSAATAYSQDSTQANCEAYKKAYQDYLDEAEDIKPCVPADEKDDFQRNIDDARKELDDLPC